MKHGILRASDASATLAVRDLRVARRFYEGTLGLSVAAVPSDDAICFRTGSTLLVVYRSRYFGTNQATNVTWRVGDIEAVVRELRARGVAFERYPMPGMRLKGDIHVADHMKAAWFMDPDGNVLSIVSGVDS